MALYPEATLDDLRHAIADANVQTIDRLAPSVTAEPVDGSLAVEVVTCRIPW